MFSFQWCLFVSVLASSTIECYSSGGPRVLTKNVSDSCPPWFNKNLSTNRCDCGSSLNGIVSCNATLKTYAVLDCYCITRDATGNHTIAGACLYNCGALQPRKLFDYVYHKLPNKVSDLEDAMCGSLNRGGPLCGRCKNVSYMPVVYSLDVSCIWCPDKSTGWWKFILVALVPVTVFFFVMLLFNISVASYFHAFVLFSQGLVTAANASILLTEIQSYETLSYFVRMLTALYGVWNLDFFRSLIPHFCLDLDTFDILVLNWVLTFYPLLLVISSCIFIELHERRFRPIVVIWSPFHRFFSMFRRSWNIKTSATDAFATFFVLMFGNLISVSVYILTPTQVYDVDGKRIGLYLYYDASIEYWGHRHLPYAVFAVVVFTVAVCLPVFILVAYPLTCFQQCIQRRCCRVFNWEFLKRLINSFQKSLRDGTVEGTRDCRWFPVVYLIARVVIFIVFGVTENVMYYLFAILVLCITAVLVIVVQPYKREVAHYTKTDFAFILLLAMFYASILAINIAEIKGHSFIFFTYFLALGISVIPLVCVCCVVIQWIFTRRSRGRRLVRKLWDFIQGNRQAFIDGDDSLPDRIINPNYYPVDEDLSDVASSSYQYVDRSHEGTFTY